MKNITNYYGEETNLLECTLEDCKVLESFLKKLGVRCRVTKWDSQGNAIVQAENPYKNWIDRPDGKKYADADMTDEQIKWYRR